MENRAQKYHRGRLSAAIREEIETIIEGELGDPRIGLASVNEVVLAGDSRSARVFLTVNGDDAEAESTLQGLNAAAGYIRHEVAERLHLRRSPEIHFQVDRSGEVIARVEDLLSRTKKRASKQEG